MVVLIFAAWFPIKRAVRAFQSEQRPQSAYEMKFSVVALLSHMKDHLIPRRMQFTASRYLFSFQSYEGLNIPNQSDIKKGLRTRICKVI